MAKFEAGTKAVMDFVVDATAAGAISIIGMKKRCHGISQPVSLLIKHF